VHLLEASPKYPSRYTLPFETLVPTNTSIVQTPNLELKQLPEHLAYAYLGENKMLPVIVATNLSLGEEEKLLRVLREQKIHYSVLPKKNSLFCASKKKFTILPYSF
jgi:hypothetical protein